ncbi:MULTISPECIES: YdcH family protein [unclassified Marinobacter]|uniref:YdcH family protein n=1 Tax=unclassified Marinobacter TaxID=83889 RepID=UPI00126864AE|nr:MULTISPECIES: DUF465 domain-containing protein [unclassified Marinobacter]QFS87144.1 hypothetical protein FIV08_09900 [Marinobacter sp. THAF197a]QFT50928.1 hypothetical protein FIU96_09820 [Marinobacter sp. THAF39]
MGISNHELHHEFPQHSDLIDRLSEQDAHFREQLKEYAKLDKEIYALERRDVPVSDESFTRMKSDRAHLKDKLYNALLKAADD